MGMLFTLSARELQSGKERGPATRFGPRDSQVLDYCFSCNFSTTLSMLKPPGFWLGGSSARLFRLRFHRCLRSLPYRLAGWFCIDSSTLLMLRLEPWAGGNSFKLSRYPRTNTCDGTIRNIRSALHLIYAPDWVGNRSCGSWRRLVMTGQPVSCARPRYFEPPFLSSSSILERLKEPGDWLGGYSFMVKRNFAASCWIGTMTNGLSRNQSL